LRSVSALVVIEFEQQQLQLQSVSALVVVEFEQQQ
jgi:hypothetical protein